MDDMEFHAMVFAADAHKYQSRKYTGEPYIHHPEAVVALLKTVLHTTEMVMAAWLHDTVEDCGVTLEEIRDEFGSVVAMYVDQLTDVSRPEDGNRSVRKAIDRAHTAQACPAAMTIKLADLIDNSRSILERDPSFAVVYLDEKRQLLEVLKDGDPTLWSIADNIVKSAPTPAQQPIANSAGE